MTDNNQLWFVVETQEVEETTKVTGERSGEDVGGGFGESESVEMIKTLTKRKRVSLDAKALKEQMSNMLAIMDDVFTDANTRTGLQLDEVTLSVEINADAKISIVGNGGSLGNAGGMTLKFTRPK